MFHRSKKVKFPVTLTLGGANYGFPAQEALYATFDAHVKKSSGREKGVFIINDYDEDHCRKAKEFLECYIQEKHPNITIKIEILAGDYTKINVENKYPQYHPIEINIINPVPFSINAQWLAPLIHSNKETPITVITTDRSVDIFNNIQLLPYEAVADPTIVPLRYKEITSTIKNKKRYVYAMQERTDKPLSWYSRLPAVFFRDKPPIVRGFLIRTALSNEIDYKSADQAALPHHR